MFYLLLYLKTDKTIKLRNGLYDKLEVSIGKERVYYYSS